MNNYLPSLLVMTLIFFNLVLVQDVYPDQITSPEYLKAEIARLEKNMHYVQ